MTEPEFWNTAALALLPLSGVIGGFVVQSLIAGRTVYIGSITAERSKWLEKLRTNLSAYYSLSASVVHRRSELPTLADDLRSDLTRERYVDLQKLEELASQLRLQLNPDGVIDGNVSAIIEELQAHQNDEGDGMSALRELLIAHSQWLLKAEWEKVKWEAGGRLYRLWHWRDDAERRKKYARWVGAVDTGVGERWPPGAGAFGRSAGPSDP